MATYQILYWLVRFYIDLSDFHMYVTFKILYIFDLSDFMSTCQVLCRLVRFLIDLFYDMFSWVAQIIEIKRKSTFLYWISN